MGTQRIADEIQAPNYIAHALGDLRKLEAEIRESAPQTAHAYRFLIELLLSSVKFILPNCCNLIDPEEFKQSHLDMVRLPYPCIAMEAPWQTEKELESSIAGIPQSKATKRIALCWEAGPQFDQLPKLNEILKRFPQGGVFVLPIFWGPEYSQWTVPLGGSFVPYNSHLSVASIDEGEAAGRIANEGLQEVGRLSNKKLSMFVAEPFCPFPEFLDTAINELYRSRDKAFASIILDSRDEVMMLVQLCSVLNCSNVTTETIEPGEAINKKRQSKGNQPFFSYKVLQLTHDHNGIESRVLGGTHVSPRMHLRRGHIRVLDRASNRTTWVRPTMVKPDSPRGIVLKDYSVSSVSSEA
jgi:hypothetical protein